MPPVIQGAMGIYAFPSSSARLVALQGQLGVVSGTGIHLIFPRLLQLGDQGGHFRRALSAFPDQEMAERILSRYYVPEGISPATPFQNIEQFSVTPSRELIELTICANFCQVWLAKENHDGLIGVNFLEKIQMPHLYALYGVLLAQVDYLFIGAGIPIQISAVLDKLVRHEPASYTINVIGADRTVECQTYFDPRQFIHHTLPELKRPLFFPIISSSTIAQMMIKSGHHKIDGWIVETNVAGGHSASPRGRVVLTESGEPLYGVRDEIDFDQLSLIGLPYYLAGAYASPEMLAIAKSLGAIGIQSGSIFTLSNESGINPSLRDYMRKEGYNNRLIVFNDPQASPTGFPFKVVRMPGTLGDPAIYQARQRICDLGGLLQPYFRQNSSIGYRCPAEPMYGYCNKGGKKEDALNRMCLCNGLFATVGLGQRRYDGTIEPPVVTLGQDLTFLRHLMSDENDDYSIEDVILYLLS
jgi:NAD(P)H-dependent flavin oxidoreductase YrpB (nitropropane dioxygenase family)